MTLLVLDLHVPEIAAVHAEGDLLRALGELVTRRIPWVMSFLTLGIFWVGRQTQLNHFDRSDRDLTWIHLAFLLAVTLTPFSTALLAHFIVYRTALLVYWANVLLLGAILYASWTYARRAGLLKPAVPPRCRLPSGAGFWSRRRSTRSAPRCASSAPTPASRSSS